jgi:phosphoribosyl 1,2-cyclic phosphodiesterase
MNTLCVGVRAGANTIIFDAGSGICGLKALPNFKNTRYNLFFSHYHVDHIHGLLFWDVLFDPNCSIDVYGQKTKLGGVLETCDRFLNEPYQPAGLNEACAKVSFADIRDGSETVLQDGVSVISVGLSHPGGCLGHCIRYNGKSVCYISDVGLSGHKDGDPLFEAAKGADLLIMDSFFGNRECIPDWGHSSASDCARFAKKAGAKQLALYHYDYNLSDEEIAATEETAKAIFADSFAPADGMCISI